MAKPITAFQSILSSFVTRRSLDPAVFSGFSDSDWAELYKISRKQGVVAVVLEQLNTVSSEVVPPASLALRWICDLTSVEQSQRRKMALCREFGAMMASEGISTVVLKGVALAQYYPEPSHREFGDLDCFLVDSASCQPAYERGNILAERDGAAVNRGHYKHSHIHWRGLEIENHQFCLGIRGNRKMKQLERHLREVLEPCATIENTYLFTTSADFNALFFTAHAMNHFLYESIRMRHILDWALFLQAKRTEVNWDEFWRWCDKMHFTRFVKCLNLICDKCLGTDFSAPEDERLWPVAQRILSDIYSGESVYSKGGTKWEVRWRLVRNFFRSSWKYRLVCRRSALLSLVSLGLGMAFDRTPRI